jgi:hypothetical protein
MSGGWYYAKGGRRFGPFTAEQFRQLAASGLLSPADMAWNDRTQQWLSAGAVEGLFPTGTGLPPEPEPLFVAELVEEPRLPVAQLAAAPGHDAPAPPSRYRRAPAGDREETLELSSNQAVNDKKSAPQEHGAAIAAFLVIPLYTIMIGAMLVGLLWHNWESLGGAAKNPHIWKFVALIFVCLVGFSVRSLECAVVITENPYRAFAMGRYIFGLFLAVNLSTAAYTQWPSSKLEAPAGAVLVADQGSILLDAKKTHIRQVGLLDYGIYFVNLAFNGLEDFAVLLFLIAGYKALRGSRAEYIWDHFVYDISFGWTGKAYR